MKIRFEINNNLPDDVIILKYNTGGNMNITKEELSLYKLSDGTQYIFTLVLGDEKIGSFFINKLSFMAAPDDEIKIILKDNIENVLKKTGVEKQIRDALYSNFINSAMEKL